jgi:hypothetical protein
VLAVKKQPRPLDADDLRARDDALKKPLPLDAAEILAWCDAWHKRKGKWPKMEDGPIPEAPLGTTWRQVDNGLRLGLRGLPGSSSLARLLAERRGYRNKHGLPRLTEDMIVGWAEAYYSTCGTWPTERDSVVVGSDGETWTNLDVALRLGLRGLPGGDSLPQLIRRRCR